MRDISAKGAGHEAAFDEMMREKICASLADKRADIPAEDVSASLRAYHEDQLKAGRSARADKPKA